MTVAVAALCEGCKEGALATDRMITFAGGVHTQTCKISMFCDGRVLVARAGNWDQASFVLERLRSREATLANSTVGEFVAVIAAARQELALKLAERRREELDSALPLLGSSPALRASATPEVTALLERIATAIVELSLTADFLIMGRDLNGLVQVYTVEGHAGLGVPALPHDPTTIGAGAAHARSSLGRWAVSKDLAETVYKVYEARKYAESVIGVGGEVDLAVFRDGQKAAFLPPEAVKGLEKIYWKTVSTARTLPEEDRVVVTKAIATLGEDGPPSVPPTHR
jgi:hypothetical protein